MFGALKRGFRSTASLILVRNVVGELQPKRTLAASRGFLAAARLSCCKMQLGNPTATNVTRIITYRNAEIRSLKREKKTSCAVKVNSNIILYTYFHVNGIATQNGRKSEI